MINSSDSVVPHTESNIEDEVEDASTVSFESDDSEDEFQRNTIGDVPIDWYDDMDHRGYDISGRRIRKCLMSSKIDDLLNQANDPDRWRTIRDLKNEQEIYLTDADIEIIRRLRQGLYPDSKVNEEDYVVEYEHKDSIHPVRFKDVPKSRFLPSKDETKEIRRLVKLIREGKLRPRKPQRKSTNSVFDIWANEDNESTVKLRGPRPVPAPKMPLPDHGESYHPPEEYLFTEEEEKAWLEGDDSVRTSTFIPKTYPCLRRVPWYDAFVTERFHRCLDLYTLPREFKKKMNIDPESLFPVLPKTSDLRPFPTSVSVEFVGHEGPVRSIAVSPNGEYIVSCGGNKVCVWDSMNGKCIWEQSGEDLQPVRVAWHPNNLPIIAIGDKDGSVHFVSPKELVINDDCEVQLDLMFKQQEADGDNFWKSSSVYSNEKSSRGFSVSCADGIPVGSISWHPKGNFVAVVLPTAPSREKTCFILSLSARKLVKPLKGKTGSSSGGAKFVVFHPTKPHLIITGQQNVLIFDLKSQSRVKLLHSGCKQLSCVAVHPITSKAGEHVVAASLDSKIVWFDTELQDKPWKNLRYHTSAVRQVTFHSDFPLMASAGDDSCVHITHTRVFDSSKNPDVIPVKKLEHPAAVSDCKWHPHLPWAFTACADGTVRLWT